MKVRPRLNLLEIWRGVAATSYQDGKWIWGGRYQSNSVSDAQQLLCLMFPATEIAAFALADPDRTEDSALEALAVFGGALEIPTLLVRVLNDYLDRYTRSDGSADFSGGSQFLPRDPAIPPTEQQYSLDVVESFATSLTLMLATLSFTRNFGRMATRPDLKADLQNLETRASRRLTAAMIGLLRSFTVNTFDVSSGFGKLLMRSINQAGHPERRVIHDLREELRAVITSLGDEITIGSGQGKGKDLESSSRLFECGWSWGIITGTEPINLADVGQQPAGYAADAPYLYFTMVALDAIADLFTDRTRRAGLLDEEQQRLARALQIRWDLTQEYWAVLADFGSATWPLEDIPWRATDNVESDYLSLLVAGVAMRNLIERRADDQDLSRLGKVLVELASRGRITRRPLQSDQALPSLHEPGFELVLEQATPVPGPELRWPVQDYAAVLLKRTVRVASMLKDTQLQAEMIQLIDALWGHLVNRRIQTGSAKNLWDHPGRVFPSLGAYSEPSWQMTIRVVESLVVAANLVSSDPLRSDQLHETTQAMLSEAEHLLDQELLGGADESGPAIRRTIQAISAKMERAKSILTKRPASSFALATDVLLELDRLAAAREDSTWAR